MCIWWVWVRDWDFGFWTSRRRGEIKRIWVKLGIKLFILEIFWGCVKWRHFVTCFEDMRGVYEKVIMVIT
ncbi:unnamed protein product [Moneuplotes crassus]|uniref:Uncharacterized protein n=1 Tax=Euplotes crassus TaxID=5936 RepID=A0AAD2D3H5_EUPCR|nr:unnamed protein product [Moneuplotes crassus]